MLNIRRTCPPHCVRQCNTGTASCSIRSLAFYFFASSYASNNKRESKKFDEISQKSMSTALEVEQSVPTSQWSLPTKGPRRKPWRYQTKLYRALLFLTQFGFRLGLSPSCQPCRKIKTTRLIIILRSNPPPCPPPRRDRTSNSSPSRRVTAPPNYTFPHHRLNLPFL